VAPAGGVLRFRIAALVVVAIAGAGWAAGAAVERAGLATPAPLRANMFQVLFVRHETSFLAGLSLFALLASLWPAGAPSRVHAVPAGWSPRRWRLVSALVACAVLLFTLLGTSAFLHRLAFSMDEFVASFQARIFSAGRIEAPLPREWWRFGFALTPVFVEYKRTTHVWIETYLPVYAVVRAGFLRLGVEHLTNAFLAALSIPVLAGIARRLWPERSRTGLLALLFLAVSSQFLLMSMTAYAMPAHLLLNLVWLWLYLRRDRASWLLLPWVGVLALGLHHPFPHALFAAPFLLRLLFRHRGRWLGYICAVYAVGIAACWTWLRYTQPFTSRGGFWTLFSFPSLSSMPLQAMHLAITCTWQSPIVPVLLVSAVLTWRSLPPVGRDLAAGLVVTFLFYCLFPIGQGHGWGYRYIYGVLGNVVLLAAYGLEMAREQWRRGEVLVAASLAASIVLQVPNRATQAERFVRPFARALDNLSTIPAAVIVVDPAIAWYAQDLVRNSPFLDNEPKVVNGGRMPPSRRRELDQLFPGRVRDLRPEELRRLEYPGVVAPEGSAKY
jgi:hypothetical protein